MKQERSNAAASPQGTGNRRRYDEVVSFVAAIVFGTALPEYGSFTAGLESLGIGPAWARAGGVVFFCVFFRNIHGLIAYDIWADARSYNPPFEQTARAVAGNFLFGLVAVLLTPYFFFGGVKDDGSMFKDNLVVFALALFAPLAVYVVWDLYWYARLRPSRRKEDAELRKFTEDWLYQDLILGLVCAIAVILFATPRWQVDHSTILFVFIVAGVSVLGWDYLTHVNYYFAVPPAQDLLPRFYEYGQIWDRILPDGLHFCHWGGRHASEELVGELDGSAGKGGLALEVCCGHGGTCSLLADAIQKPVAVDISLMALRDVLTRVPDARVVCADAGEMPFLDGQFSTLVMQDGDAWFGDGAETVFGECARVAADRCQFVMQTYVATERMTEEIEKETSKRLRGLGYRGATTPKRAKLLGLLEGVGFNIETERNVRDMYLEDAKRMLQRYRESWYRLHWDFLWEEVSDLRAWLIWSAHLFEHGYWTGVVVTARREIAVPISTGT